MGTHDLPIDFLCELCGLCAFAFRFGFWFSELS
jgi:hypothetical protein